MFAALGIVLGRKGAQDFNESLARTGFYMSIAFFLILGSALLILTAILR